MTFEWKHYLELAENTLQNCGEPGKRSAISRAYYAAFKTFCVYFESKGKTLPNNAAAHGAVRDEASKCKWFVQARQLNDLRNLRNDADYSLAFVCTDDAVKLSLDTATKLISFIRPKIKP